jgi:hypothetical protein
MTETSKIRRKDRRGVTPQHILHMAMKILQLRVSEGLYATFRRVGESEHIAKRIIEDKEYIIWHREKLVLFNINPGNQDSTIIFYFCCDNRGPDERLQYRLNQTPHTKNPPTCLC